MKYATLDPQEIVTLTSESKPELVLSIEKIVEISEKNAEIAKKGLELRPKILHVYRNKKLTPLTDWLRNHRWSEDTGEWLEFVPVVPESVTPRQIRLALIDRGIMPEEITAQLSAIEDPVLRAKSLAEWEFASEVKRNHPLIAQLTGALQFTDDDVDEIFREADAL